MSEKQTDIKKDFLPGAIVLPGFTPERKCVTDVKVWEDRGKLFIRTPIEGDHPQQIEVNIINKTYDVYGHD